MDIVVLVERGWRAQLREQLQGVLADARAGTLEPDWRTSRADALAAARRTAATGAPVPGFPDLGPLGGLRLSTPVERVESAMLALREVADMPCDDWLWEPHRAPAVGPVRAIGSWYTMSLDLLADACEWGKHRAGTTAQDADPRERARRAMWDDRHLMDREELRRSCEAALQTAGVAGDWVAAARQRLTTLPRGRMVTARVSLELMPDYRARLEQVPAYWMG